MQLLRQKLDQTAARERSVRAAAAAAAHLTAAAGLLAGLVVADKLGVLPLAVWTESGVYRHGEWSAPTLTLPLLIRNLILGGLGLALALAWLRAWLVRPSAAQAAAALDQGAELRERLTTAVVFGDRTDAFSAAVRQDAENACREVDPDRLFPLRLGGWGRPLTGALLLLAGAICVLPELDLRGRRALALQQQLKTAQDRAEVRRLAADLRQRAAELKAAPPEALPAPQLAELLKRMEELAARLDQDRLVDANQAKEMINRLQDQLREEAQKSAAEAAKLAALGSDRRQRQLLDKLTERLKENDPAGAARELGRLRRRLQEKGLKREELEKLSKELDDLRQQMNELGLEKLSKNFDDLADDLHDLQNSRDLDKWRKLQEKLGDSLKNLQQQDLDLSSLSEEERRLLKQLREALNKMELTEDRLKQMEKAAQEGKLRQLTLEDLRKMLEEMKKGQNGNQGDQGSTGHTNNGVGLANLPMPAAGGSSGGQPGSGSGSGGKGAGYGRGGKGVTPDQIRDAVLDPKRLAAARMGAGEVVSQWFVRGEPSDDPHVKTAYSQAVEAAASSPENLREQEVIPSEDRDFVREYHNALRTGQK